MSAVIIAFSDLQMASLYNQSFVFGLFQHSHFDLEKIDLNQIFPFLYGNFFLWCDRFFN